MRPRGDPDGIRLARPPLGRTGVLRGHPRRATGRAGAPGRPRRALPGARGRRRRRAVAAERGHGGDARGAGVRARPAGAHRDAPLAIRESPRRSQAALTGGADTLVGLVLAPHCSALSIGKYRTLFAEAVPEGVETRFVERWGADPAFVDALARRCRVALTGRRCARGLHGALAARAGSSPTEIRTGTSCWRRPH